MNELEIIFIRKLEKLKTCIPHLTYTYAEYVELSRPHYVRILTKYSASPRAKPPVKETVVELINNE